MTTADLIREIRQGKQNLEVEIANLISKYEKETGVSVSNVEIQKILTMGSVTNLGNIIKLNINL